MATGLSTLYALELLYHGLSLFPLWLSWKNVFQHSLETGVSQDGMEKHVKPGFMPQNWRFLTLLSPVLLPIL